MKYLAIIILFPILSWAKTYEFSGQAYKSENKKQQAYLEKHTIELNKDEVIKSKTVYYNTDNEEIAVLSCDYTKERFHPEFEFTDSRTGYWEKVVDLGKTFRVQYRESENSKIVSKEFSKQEYFSASQGLNELIKSNLMALYKGQDVTTSFLLPSRMQNINMLIRGKAMEEGKIKVTIEVKNFFLRMFAPKLEMVYAKNSGKLMNYYGQSNIVTAKGDKQKVYIEYNYPKELKVALNER